MKKLTDLDSTCRGTRNNGAESARLQRVSAVALRHKIVVGLAFLFSAALILPLVYRDFSCNPFSTELNI